MQFCNDYNNFFILLNICPLHGVTIYTTLTGGCRILQLPPFSTPSCHPQFSKRCCLEETILPWFHNPRAKQVLQGQAEIVVSTVFTLASATLKCQNQGTSLINLFQWLILCTSPAGGAGSIPAQGTILHIVGKKEKETQSPATQERPSVSDRTQL